MFGRRLFDVNSGITWNRGEVKLKFYYNNNKRWDVAICEKRELGNRRQEATEQGNKANRNMWSCNLFRRPHSAIASEGGDRAHVWQAGNSVVGVERVGGRHGHGHAAGVLVARCQHLPVLVAAGDTTARVNCNKITSNLHHFICQPVRVLSSKGRARWLKQSSYELMQATH